MKDHNNDEIDETFQILSFPQAELFTFVEEG
jgi:hypothetical protein